ELVAGRWDDLSPASDVYAVGAILYEMLAGDPPFAAAWLADAEWVMTRMPDPPTLFNPAVPADLESICLRCLAKDPRARYGTAAGLAAALAQFLAAPDGSGATASFDLGGPPADVSADQAYRIRVISGLGEAGPVFPLP